MREHDTSQYPRSICAQREAPLGAHAFQKDDFGYFHLTERGWIRRDALPFPSDRVETWRYEEERPASDAKDRIRLTRIWSDHTVTDYRRNELRIKFGNAIAPTEDRHLVIDCLV
jgi:hypothetical protein